MSTVQGRWNDYDYEVALFERNGGVVARYKIIACRVLWRELCYFAARSRNVFDFVFLEQGLHNTPDKLRTELQQAIDAVGSGYDALLIGYGLCSNGVAGICARDIPLVVVRGHDCITHLLGSKEAYREYFDSHPGTYWYSPGWIETGTQPGRERYEKTLKKYEEEYGADNAVYLMEMEQGWFREYNNAAYVDLGYTDNQSERAYAKKCAKWLNWSYDELRGDPRLVLKLLEGNWPETDFLIVPPGRRIAASHDEDILRLEE